MAKDHKAIERKVAKYLGCAADEYGSRRDWKELQDLHRSGVSPDGLPVTWMIEVKSHEWRTGPKSLWAILDDGLDQCISAMQRNGTWGSSEYLPVCIYWPTRCPSDGSALAYLELNGLRVVLPLRLFKQVYVDPCSEAMND